MMIKIVLSLAVLMVTVTGGPMMSTRPTATSPVELSIIQLEEPCVRQGGICMKIDDCGPGNLVHMRGVLCPMQRDMGVECCYL